MSSFDRLQEMNPMPDDHLPSPPSSLAERILAGRRRSAGAPGWAIAVAAAALVVVAGGSWLLFLRGGGSEPLAAGDTSTTSASSTSPSAPPDTTMAITTTEAPIDEATTTVPPAGTCFWGDPGGPPIGCPNEFPIYLFLADDGTENVPGPFLVPTMRTTAVLSAPITNIHRTVAAFLLIGPTPGELDAAPAMSTAIPEGTEVLDVEVADGVATIDLSAEFVSGGGSLSMMGRLAQVVFTLTAFDDVDGVRFEIEGEPTTVFGGEGVIVEDPAIRAGFEDLLPAVMIESPPYWGQAGNPIVVSGTANVFEATVSLALTDGDGLILWEGFTTATCGTGCRGDFTIEIPYDVVEPQLGSIIAWEASARDGSQTNVREHPVWLTPGEGASDATTTTTHPDQALWRQIQDLHSEVVAYSARISATRDRAATEEDPEEAAALGVVVDDLRNDQDELRAELATAVDRGLALGWPYDLILNETCSGAAAETKTEGLTDQALDRPALETWGSLHQAAIDCDWASLAELLGDPFTAGFGLIDDPIGYWQHQEALGYEPMRYLADLLDRPHAETLRPEGSTLLVWPSAFAHDTWDEIPAEEIEALRPLYGDADFADFASFGGYVGYRIGIDLETGEWRFFVAGD